MPANRWLDRISDFFKKMIDQVSHFFKKEERTGFDEYHRIPEDEEDSSITEESDEHDHWSLDSKKKPGGLIEPKNKKTGAPAPITQTQADAVAKFFTANKSMPKAGETISPKTPVDPSSTPTSTPTPGEGVRKWASQELEESLKRKRDLKRDQGDHPPTNNPPRP